MAGGPEFPPLLRGLAVAGDPLVAACAAAEKSDPGCVFYAPDERVMQVALLLAPETPLREAIGVSFAASLGFNDALGALAPPEVAVHFEWPDRVRVNGALCGALRAVASSAEIDSVPDWLVVGLDVPIFSDGTDGGANPETTDLHAEGCGDITSPVLIEAWARHMMNWLHIYLTDGFEPLHRDWLVKAHGREEGRFLGLDEHGGLIVKDGDATRILPLTDMVEGP